MMSSIELNLMKLEVEFDVKPTKRQIKMAEMGFKVPLGKFRRPGWTGDIQFYLFHCEKHGLVYDYKHGHIPYVMCVQCFEESQDHT